MLVRRPETRNLRSPKSAIIENEETRVYEDEHGPIQPWRESISPTARVRARSNIIEALLLEAMVVKPGFKEAK